MKKIYAIGIALILIASSTLTGCVHVVRTPPPPPRAEIRPAPPFRGAVWIDGHWNYRHGQWLWAPGHWKKRPGPKAVWVPGHWKKTFRGWKWAPGHWR